jgi:hypothetical protein
MERDQKLAFFRGQIHISFMPGASLETLTDEELDQFVAIVQGLAREREDDSPSLEHYIAPIVEAHLKRFEFLGYWDTERGHWAVVCEDIMGIGDSPGEWASVGLPLGTASGTSERRCVPV